MFCYNHNHRQDIIFSLHSFKLWHLNVTSNAVILHITFVKTSTVFVTVQGVLLSHDAIAQKDYYPHLPEIPPLEADDEDEETIKIVQLVKSNEPLVCFGFLFLTLVQGI